VRSSRNGQFKSQRFNRQNLIQFPHSMLYSLESAAGADAISDGGAGWGSSESAESVEEEGAVSPSLGDRHPQE
jgi:hypothetical protein